MNVLVWKQIGKAKRWRIGLKFLIADIWQLFRDFISLKYMFHLSL